MKRSKVMGNRFMAIGMGSALRAVRLASCLPARLIIITILVSMMALFAVPTTVSADDVPQNDGPQNPVVFQTQTFVRTRGNTPTSYNRQNSTSPVGWWLRSACRL